MTLHLKPSDARRLGLQGRKVLRRDREAKVYDLTGCGYQCYGEKLLCWLPFPPSVNTYWRSYRGRTVLSKDGKAYRKAVEAIMAGGQPMVPYLSQERRVYTGRLIVTMELYPPDKRLRDVDNYAKSVFDSLAHAGVFENDGQIDELRVKRGGEWKSGRVVVEIRET